MADFNIDEKLINQNKKAAPVKAASSDSVQNLGRVNSRNQADILPSLMPKIKQFVLPLVLQSILSIPRNVIDENLTAKMQDALLDNQNISQIVKNIGNQTPDVDQKNLQKNISDDSSERILKEHHAKAGVPANETIDLAHGDLDSFQEPAPPVEPLQQEAPQTQEAQDASAAAAGGEGLEAPQLSEDMQPDAGREMRESQRAGLEGLPEDDSELDSEISPETAQNEPDINNQPETNKDQQSPDSVPTDNAPAAASVAAGEGGGTPTSDSISEPAQIPEAEEPNKKRELDKAKKEKGKIQVSSAQKKEIGQAGAEAGAAVGKTAGAAIGGAIGSVIPGAGTEAGAKLGGQLGGTAGKWAGKKAAESAVSDKGSKAKGLEKVKMMLEGASQKVFSQYLLIFQVVIFACAFSVVFFIFWLGFIVEIGLLLFTILQDKVKLKFDMFNYVMFGLHLIFVFFQFIMVLGILFLLDLYVSYYQFLTSVLGSLLSGALSKLYAALF